MTRFPGADMIVDVARAADPAKHQAAVRRLTDIASNSGLPSPSFARELAAVSNTSPRRDPQLVTHSPLLKVHHSGEMGLPSAQRASRQFEAFVLQTFVEQVLPSEKTGLFGDEVAGGIWRSMMAEQISVTFAKAGGIGVAKMLEKQLTLHAAEQANDATKLIRKTRGV